MNDDRTTTHVNAVWTVGIPVTDQDRALRFYRDALGFETRIDGEFGPGQRWVEVAPPGSTISIALVKAEPGAAGIDTQVRLATSDAAGDHASLGRRGVDVDAEIIPFPIPMFAFRDPDGNRLVIVEAASPGGG